MAYLPAEARYASMTYNRCGRSGLKLPGISLGLWHNFGGVDQFENGRAMLRRALDQIVRSGKALYAGISNYPAEQTREAARILRALGTPCLIHQPNYNMFNRWIEDGLLAALREEGMGTIAFSPLAQGMLTDRY